MCCLIVVVGAVANVTEPVVNSDVGVYGVVKLVCLWDGIIHVLIRHVYGWWSTGLLKFSAYDLYWRRREFLFQFHLEKSWCMDVINTYYIGDFNGRRLYQGRLTPTMDGRSTPTSDMVKHNSPFLGRTWRYDFTLLPKVTNPSTPHLKCGSLLSQPRF